MPFLPLIQAITSPNLSRYTIHKHSQAQNIIFQVYTHISLSAGSPFLPTNKKTGNSCDFFIIIIIRECGSTLYVGKCGITLYVGLQHAVPPTNTTFKPLLLPTQAGIQYTNTHKHRTSYFKSTLTFLGPAKCWRSISADRQKREILAIFHYNNRKTIY